MFCAISGVTPEEPVVSTKSGLLFEKRLIEKCITETGRCPVTGDLLTLQDIVSVKSNKAVRPRISPAASLPGMLSLFQNEWDALMLRDCELEGQLNTVRQELSYALYQSDAAVRVIARLIRERDEARTLLAQAEKQLTSAPAAAPVASTANGKRVSAEEEEEDEKAAKRARPGISSSIIAELTECNAQLSSQRKKRQISGTLTKPDDISKFTQISSHPLHKTVKPGILSVDILPEKNLILTGGLDSSAVLFNKSSGEVVANLSGHSKRVNSVKFVADENVVLTASADKTVRVWKKQGEEYQSHHVINDHSGEVKALSVHATKSYFVSASLDKSWGFYDLSTGSCLVQVNDPSVDAGYNCAAFHPDGLILGTGSLDSLVRIWDVKSQSNVAKFEGHQGAVTSISFSENGYFLATAASDGVKLWDLRKLKNFRTFTPYDSSVPANSVEFDFSGSYLAIAGSDIRIYQVGGVKQEWNMIKTLPDVSGTEKVMAVKFGPDASYIAAGTMDRNLRIFAIPDSTNNMPESVPMES